MTYLVFDTETTGLFKFKWPVDHPTQPWVIQLAARLYNNDGSEIESLLQYVYPPDGIGISLDALRVHGISMKTIADNGGVTQEVMLEEFSRLARLADKIVGFNTPFDIGLVEAAAARIDPAHYGALFAGVPTYCVMRALTGVLKQKPFRYGTWKWPKLEVAVRMCLDREHVGAHDAMVDVEATKELYEYCLLLEQLNDREPDVKKHFQLRY